jgi:hypothetical protein
MIKARDEWNVVLGGPGSRLHDYSSMNFLSSFLRKDKRKEKIKKIFNDNRKEK